MTKSQVEMCDRAAEPILSGDWENLRSSDPIRLHILSCKECQSRIEEVRFFSEAFSSDDPRVGLKRKHSKASEVPLPLPQPKPRATWAKPLAKVASFVAAACFVAILAWNYLQPDGIGRVAAIEGEATIRRFGERSEDKLDLGARVYEGDMIRTEPNSKLHLQLEESNGIHLNESSEIRIEATRLIHHSVGETWFEIAKGKGEFEVEARGADVLVLGTSFGVGYEDDTVRVPVSSGRVRLLTKGGEIELDPGHVGFYSSSKPYLPPSRGKELYTKSRPSWLLTSLDEEAK